MTNKYRNIMASLIEEYGGFMTVSVVILLQRL